MKQVAIIGLGNFGFALLKHFDVKNETILQKNPQLHEHTYLIKAFDRRQEVITSLQGKRKHPYLFKEQTISKHVLFFDDIGITVEDADYIILAISSYALEEVFTAIKPYLKEKTVIINTSKALQNKSGERYSQVAKRILGKNPYALLAGGTHATDLFLKEPLGAVITSENKDVLKDLKNVFNSYNLSMYPSHDLKGTEYASALKNVISILAGIVNGMGFSQGSETYVISRAAFEAETLIVNTLGGKKDTFSMGSQCWGNDLWMSCIMNTRNKELGIHLGKGLPLQKALSKMEKEGKTVEGVNTVKILSKITSLKNYPLLLFMDQLFNNKINVEEIKKIIFNHDF